MTPKCYQILSKHYPHTLEIHSCVLGIIIITLKE